MMTTSAPLALAAQMLSYTTAAGSLPSSWRTISAPERSAQTPSCSAAAARKVSPAQRRTFFPCSRSWWASFPMVVVLPTPFTPTIKITEGLVSSFRSVLPTFRSLVSSSTRPALASSP